WKPARGELVTDPSSGQQADTSTFTLPAASAPWVLGTSSFTEYREEGTIKQIGGDRFIYDRVDRLVRAELDGSVASNHFRAYAYDIHGNRLSINRNGTVDGEPIDSGTNQLALGHYDPSGNLEDYNTGTFIFSWDGNNTLPSAAGPDFSKAYLYTADDERLATLDLTDLASGTVRETWTLRGLGNEVLRVWETENGSWSWKRDYIYRGNALAASETADDSGPLHYHQDHLGSARLITTSTGAVKSRHVYFLLGTEFTSPGTEQLKFTGHERDKNGNAAAGADDFDYMHARYCLPDGLLRDLSERLLPES
ncbi:MAG: hypothetical protein AAFX50_17600, partial [Acidobacteriota bacterium]